MKNSKFNPSPFTIVSNRFEVTEKMLSRFSKGCVRLTSKSSLCSKALSTSVDPLTTKKIDFFNPTEEHRSLREMLRNFVETEVDPQALEYNRTETFNVDLFRKLGDLGLLGITADVKYGGSGMDAVAACIAHEELAASDPAFCLSFLAHSMLFVNNLNQNGNEQQKAKYLPDVCSGVKVGGMCMSEPGVGTDVLGKYCQFVCSQLTCQVGMSTTAVPSEDGSYYTLNGAKMWITNGTIDGKTTGDVYLVYAKTGKGRGGNDLTSFIVEKDTPGFTLGQKINDKCGMRASMTAELVFQDVKVPKENIIGKVGGATLCMMRNLEIERITLAAMSLGIARRSIEIMNKYSVERKAFGKSIGDFGQVSIVIFIHFILLHINCIDYLNSYRFKKQ